MGGLTGKLIGGAITAALMVVLAGWIQHQHVRSERLADCQAIAAGELGRTKGERCPAPVADQLRALGRALKGDLSYWDTPDD